MMTSLRVLLLAGVIVAAGMSSVEAGVMYSFSYVLGSGDTLSGQLEGALQGDNDTVFVDSVTDLKFNAVLVGSFPFLDSFTNEVLGTGSPPTVSISGTTMDLLVADSASVIDGFLFDTTGLFRSPVYNSGVSFGFAFETYDPVNWTLTPTAAVPEPSSIGMFTLVGALGMMFARRKQRIKTLAA